MYLKNSKYKGRNGWMNLKKIDTEWNEVFETFLLPNSFSTFFLFPVTFDVMLGEQFCFTWNSGFVIYKYT